jgi:hypothetical protein
MFNAKCLNYVLLAALVFGCLLSFYNEYLFCCASINEISLDAVFLFLFFFFFFGGGGGGLGGFHVAWILAWLTRLQV